MAGKNAIQILRGNNVETNSSTKGLTLLDGQPLYDRATGYLYIGEGGTIANTTPIKASYANEAGTAADANHANTADRANTASSLSTRNEGNNSSPVYFSDGVPVECSRAFLTAPVSWASINSKSFSPSETVTDNWNVSLLIRLNGSSDYHHIGLGKNLAITVPNAAYPVTIRCQFNGYTSGETFVVMDTQVDGSIYFGLFHPPAATGLINQYQGNVALTLLMSYYDDREFVQKVEPISIQLNTNLGAALYGTSPEIANIVQMERQYSGYGAYINMNQPVSWQVVSANMSIYTQGFTV